MSIHTNGQVAKANLENLVSQGLSISDHSNDQASEHASSVDWETLAPKKSSSTQRNMRRLCISLHLFLIAVHIALLVIQNYCFEQNITSTYDSNILSTALTALQNVVYMMFSTALVVVTQRLAIRRNLLINQTLTATNDKTYAWSGLGSALLSLWNQKSFAAAVWGTLAVTSYLSCIAILHATTTSLFNIEPFNNTASSVASTLALPNISLDLNNPIYTSAMWINPASLISFFDQIDQESPAGLMGNTVYDVPQENILGTVSVNATSMEVTCGYFPVSSVKPTRVSPNNASWGEVSVSTDTYNVSFDLQNIDENIVSYAPLNSHAGTFLGRDVVLYSSINFTDSSGSLGPVVTLNPPMGNPQMVLYGPDTVNSVQVIGCTLSMSNYTTLADGTTKSLIPAYSGLLPPKTASRWTEWHPHIVQDLGRPFESIEDPSIDTWRDAFFAAPGSSGSSKWSLCDTVAGCPSLSTLEESISNKLGVVPWYAEAGKYNESVFTLHALENALANMTASLFWCAVHGKATSATVAEGLSFPKLSGTSPVSLLVLSSRLHLNFGPIIIGLGTSVVLLILALILVRSHGTHDAETLVDSLGVLPLTWLIHDRAEFAQFIKDFGDDVPSLDNLRRAGMIEVRLGVHTAGRSHGMDCGEADLDVEAEAETPFEKTGTHPTDSQGVVYKLVRSDDERRTMSWSLNIRSSLSAV